MSFVQVMQMNTSRFAEAQAAADDWDKATEGKRTLQRSLICRDRDNPNRYAIIAFFGSHEDAMKNSELPETDALSKKMAALADGPPSFLNLDVIEERN